MLNTCTRYRAFLLALTLTPALATKILPAQTEEREGRVMQFVHALYRRPVTFASRRPRLAVTAVSTSPAQAPSNESHRMESSEPSSVEATR